MINKNLIFLYSKIKKIYEFFYKEILNNKLIIIFFIIIS
jgi:hypothetical protein